MNGPMAAETRTAGDDVKRGIVVAGIEEGIEESLGHGRYM